MSDTWIQVENLSKMYHIGHAKHRQDTQCDLMEDALRALSHIRAGLSARAVQRVTTVTDIEEAVLAFPAAGVDHSFPQDQMR